MKNLDFWIPVVGLIVASAGLAFVLASIVFPRTKAVDPIPEWLPPTRDPKTGRFKKR